MIEHTFVADWRRMVVPAILTIAVVSGALAFAFTS
jgi:hypothetical protein